MNVTDWPFLARAEEFAVLNRCGGTRCTIAGAAERLVLSPRTVESHMYSCFAKLDVARREDLRAALE